MQGWSSLQVSLAGDGDTFGLSLFEFLITGLRPEAGALCLNCMWMEDKGQKTGG